MRDLLFLGAKNFLVFGMQFLLGIETASVSSGDYVSLEQGLSCIATCFPAGQGRIEASERPVTLIFRKKKAAAFLIIASLVSRRL